ncbi:MAG TPA: family 2A encapsulin nanocompartment cargo protein cysteine desulfurase [Anaeromyxobacteraceae bacterium]|nr:family 2A encapsulin nanocompartment cargo protein cysteine desulfurase [Anaeromyxobacteraceae bacterium]
MAALVAGVPDPLALARLANELFSAAAQPAGGPLPPGLPEAAPSVSSFEPSLAPMPAAGWPPPASAVPAPGGAPRVPSIPPQAPPFGPTMASPSLVPSETELRLLPVGRAGAAAVPSVGSGAFAPTSAPEPPIPPVKIPAATVQALPAAPVAKDPTAAPDLPGTRSPNVMPAPDQLALVPRLHPGVMAAVPAFPAFAPPPSEAWETPKGDATRSPSSTTAIAGSAAPRGPAGISADPRPPSGQTPGGAVPGEVFYFLDEAAAATTSASSPLRLESLELPPESVSYDPNRVPSLSLAARPFDPRAVRRDFPILQEQVHGKPLIWLDNAATTQKPNAVIDRVSDFYRRENSNIHRAAHALAAKATDAYEAAREKVRRFLNAGATREIVFVRGTTEGVNLVSQAFGRRYVNEGDEVVITHLEHHANIVPWQMLCSERKARLRVAPVDDRGQVILEEYEKLLGPRTRLVAVSQVSNALGTVVPVKVITEAAHRHGARVLVDGAQAVSHMSVDVQGIGCDFYVFSGHKVFGPTGIGAVYARSDALDAMPPWQGGGNMIADVTFERTIYQPAPFKFEAGTGNIADAVGLGAALDYVLSIGRENIARYEHELLEYTTRGLLGVPGLRIIGTAAEKAGVISFVLDGFRTEDVGAALDREGIAVRSGHHCAQPILRRFGLESTVRPSLAPYNTCEDIDALVGALLRLQAGRGHRGT